MDVLAGSSGGILDLPTAYRERRVTRRVRQHKYAYVDQGGVQFAISERRKQERVAVIWRQQQS
eukprot:7384299-Prymnesium_polylepis.1